MATQRKIFVFNRVSADGYFAAADGGLGWAAPDPELDALGAESAPDTGLFLFGRRTYEMFASYWPHALESGSRPPHGSAPSDAHRAMARALNGLPKLVFSKSLKAATWNNSRIAREIDPREIEALKAQPGGDILLMGSGSIVSQLTQHGLIDEYHLVVGPIFLGSGKPLISGLPNATSLRLLDVRKFSSGNVLFKYARAT